MIDAGVCFRCSCENATVGAYKLTGRRHSKNSGGRIAPAANGGLIEGAPCTVNAFRTHQSRQAGPEKADKVLKKLNFFSEPAKGWLRFTERWI
jgi:hypothetical protein